MRIKLPELFSSAGIEREYLVVRRGKEEFVLKKNRCTFEGRFADQFGFLLEGSGVKCPHGLEL